MKIKNNRLYPYPILSEQLDDYKDNTFRVDVEVLQANNDFIFTLNTKILDRNILELLHNKSVQLYMHIECSTTKFRGSYDIHSMNDFKVSIDDSLLNDEVEVIFIIAAIKTIDKFHSDSFNEFYVGNSFYIDQACVLGYTDTTLLTIRKAINSEGDIPSIFLVSQHENDKMSIELSGDKIIIYLPKQTYSDYEKLKGSYIKLKQSMINVSTLVYVLEEIKKDETDRSYDGNIWYIVIEDHIKSLSNEFKDGFSSEAFKTKDSIELAQLLMKSIVKDSFDELISLHSKSTED